MRPSMFLFAVAALSKTVSSWQKKAWAASAPTMYEPILTGIISSGPLLFVTEQENTLLDHPLLHGFLVCADVFNKYGISSGNHVTFASLFMLDIAVVDVFSSVKPDSFLFWLLCTAEICSTPANIFSKQLEWLKSH